MRKKLNTAIASGLALLLCQLMLLIPPSQAVAMRLQDITHVKGIRDNMLVGYGIVVGLSKTGDKSRSTIYSQKNLLMNFGNVVQNVSDIKSDNSASVIITTLVPPFAKAGDKLDVTVSSLADAKSLEGGVLVETQLLAPNGEVIALAQGPISTGGTSVEAAGSAKRTSINTSGRIPNGAIVERDIQTAIGDPGGLDLVLNHADFTLASHIADVISKHIAPAIAVDAGSVRVEAPENIPGGRVPFIAALDNLEVDTTCDVAKVVINERTGTIVIGSAVRLHPAAVAQGGITVTIEATNSVSQPNMMSSGGATLGVTNAKIEIEKHSGSLIQLKANSSLQDLVSALNEIGVTPTDLISILQALKAAGSLEANLEII
jgi:flagellar P-ring protein FlgI